MFFFRYNYSRITSYLKRTNGCSRMTTKEMRATISRLYYFQLPICFLLVITSHVDEQGHVSETYPRDITDVCGRLNVIIYRRLNIYRRVRAKFDSTNCAKGERTNDDKK